MAAHLRVASVPIIPWNTQVWRMMRSGEGLVSPEDLRPGPMNRAPDPRQPEVSDYVDRSRRMHCNDLENIPAFWIAGLLLVTTAPPSLLAQVLMYGFVTSRVAHFLA